jgi:hypothetical protein
MTFLFSYATTFVDRPDYAAAVLAYIKSPGPETKTRLLIERRKNEIARARVAAVPASILTAVVVVFALYNYAHKRREIKNSEA